MRGYDELAQETQANRPDVGGLGSQLADASDDQIRGVFARLMRTAGLSGNRGSGILRVGRSTYLGYLSLPLPAGFSEPRQAEPNDHADDE